MAEKQRQKPKSGETKNKAEDTKHKPTSEPHELTREQKLKRIKKLEAKLEEVKEKERRQETEALEQKIEKSVQKISKDAQLSKVENQEIEAELSALEQEIQMEDQAKGEELSPYEMLLEEHPWLEKPNYGFMYSIPEEEKDFASWRKEWAQVLLDYAKIHVQHVIYIKNLLTKRPFNKFHDRKKSAIEIAKALVEKKIAVWLDRSFFDKLFGRYEKIRIYWKSLDEWVDVMIDWARENAMFDLVMIMDIRNSDEDFANLPEGELKQIFTKIERRNKGQMVELEGGEFGIKFKLV